MLTPRPVSACVTSRTMPGRSSPTISSVTSRAGFSSPAAPRSIETRRPDGASFASADSSGMRLSSGTLTSTTPANLPASRTERLSSHVPRCAATACEISLTTPGRSSPTKVRTSRVVMKLSWNRCVETSSAFLRVQASEGAAPQITIQAGEMGNSTNWLSFPATAIVGVETAPRNAPESARQHRRQMDDCVAPKRRSSHGRFQGGRDG